MGGWMAWRLCLHKQRKYVETHQANVNYISEHSKQILWLLLALSFSLRHTVFVDIQQKYTDANTDAEASPLVIPSNA